MKIHSIQYLRGIAALLVVIGHNVFLLSGEWVHHIPNLIGVDIFFIISGFIITYATRHQCEPTTCFFIKRLCRIFPLYGVIWLMSCLFVNSDKPLDEMVCALLLCLQDYSASGPSFGFNLVGPPWTLTYEVLFYFIFGLAMAISPRYRSYLCTLLILLLTIGLQLILNGHY